MSELDDLLVYCSMCGDLCPMGEDLYAEDVCKACNIKY
jgi:hypothetical protein